MDKKKRIIFQDYEKNYAKLKTRLRHDGIGQSVFFSFIVEKYITCDLSFLPILEEMKSKFSRHGKRRLKNIEKEIKDGYDLLEELGIKESDKEEIFDLIEKEYEDY